MREKTTSTIAKQARSQYAFFDCFVVFSCPPGRRFLLDSVRAFSFLRMTFFEKAFGFTEGHQPSDNQNALLEMAVFSTITEADLWLHRILQEEVVVDSDDGRKVGNSLSFTPLGNGIDVALTGAGDATDGGGGALKRTLSTAESSGCDASDWSNVVGERCVFNVKHKITKDGAREELLTPVLIDAGIFSMPSVRELKERATRIANSLSAFERRELERIAKNTFEDDSIVKLTNMTGESLSLHGENENLGGVVQAASQFNMLEFPSPSCAPENGITQYLYDRTQGPACAIACAAGTAYRNYLVPFHELCPRLQVNPTAAPIRRGQTRDRQLNGLEGVCKDLINIDEDVDMPDSEQHKLNRYFKVFNGYVESSEEPLRQVTALIAERNNERVARLIEKIRVGVQEDTEVTSEERSGRKNQRVTITDPQTGANKTVWRYEPVPELFPPRLTQVYCSALSVGYSRVAPKLWEPLARIVLMGTYEATMYVTMINTVKLLRQGKLRSSDAKLPRTLLTKVGGGVFANDALWIKSAMLHATRAALPLRIPAALYIVHYGQIEGEYRNFPANLLEKVAPMNSFSTVERSDCPVTPTTPSSGLGPGVIAGEEEL